MTWSNWWRLCTNIWCDKSKQDKDKPQRLLYNMRGGEVWYNAEKTAEEFVDSEVEVYERYFYTLSRSSNG